MAEFTLKEGESRLGIDRDRLNLCLMQQPDDYYHVSQQCVIAEDRRDALELELKNAMIDEERAQRLEADRMLDKGVKTTEGAIKNAVASNALVRKLQMRVLDATTEAKEWNALKESFHQRSYMLRELVKIELAERYERNFEHDFRETRREYMDQERAAMRHAKIPRQFRSTRE